MKRLFMMVFIIVILLVFGIPLMVLNGFSETGIKGPEGQEQTVRVLEKAKGKIINMSLEDYLVGVVAAEMPANFNVEALKAQAVAARTYTVKRMFAFGGKPLPEHPNAEICTDPAHCQAWTDSEEQKKRWGTVKYLINIERIKAAVRSTKGIVVTYNSNFIDPVYHGSCGGKGTENSQDVWSHEVPYLLGVSCDSEYRSGEQQTSIELDKRDFAKALTAVNPDIRAMPTMGAIGVGDLIKNVQKSPQGRVKEAVIYGQKISGTDLRKALGLTSTMLTMTDKGSKIQITAIGKGHAVGLCQYGANGMALKGKTFQEILLHYYTGVKIQRLKY